MKTKMLFILTFVFLIVSSGTSQVPIEPSKPIDFPSQQKCTDLVNVQQECQDDGTVTLTFHVSNNSMYNVNYIYITDGNGWSQGISTNLPPQTVSNVQVTYTGAVPESVVCFTVKLYNPTIGICCYSKVCIRVIECPCASIGKQGIKCVPNNPYAYEFCFQVFNPAYSANTIDQITIFTGTPDLCLNGSPVPTTISIPPITPGNFGVVCVILTGCTSPLLNGTNVDLTLFLEDSNDPGYCCHMDPLTFTTPCCLGHLDCNDYNINLDGSAIPPPVDNVLNGISDVSATLNFDFNSRSVPDQLVVRVNGNIALDSGPWSTWGSSTCPLPQTNIFSGQVQVQVCDSIDITVFGNVCNVGSTRWELYVSCDSGKNRMNTNMSNYSANKNMEGYDDNFERIAAFSQASLNVFPNPVQDLLNIRTTDSNINYESVRILDNSGRAIISENMSGRTDLQIDASTLPQGTYLLEMIDDAGNKSTEKFIKLE